MWSGWRLTKRQATLGPDHLWPELWRGLARNAKLREKHKWAIEKPKLDNARRLRGIYYIDLRTRSSKKPSGMQEKIGSTSCSCYALQDVRKVKTKERSVARPVSSNQILRVSWKPVNTQECVWKNLYRNIMRTMSQEKGTIHYSITTWYTHLFLCLKQNEDTRSNSSSG